MNLEEIGLDAANMNQGIEDDSITLRYFNDENLSPDMAELLGYLRRAESWGQVRAVLSLHVDLEVGIVVGRDIDQP